MSDHPHIFTKERRHAVRFSLKLLVEWESGEGITHNLSTTGVCFRTNKALAVGAPIRLDLIPASSDRVSRQRIHCEGKIIRIEHYADLWDVAAEFTGFRFF